MLAQIMRNCLMMSFTLDSGKNVQLARSIMSLWKSSWLLLSKSTARKSSFSLRTSRIIMLLICLQNIARAILFSMMTSRAQHQWSLQVC
uniref:Uncharacterized protein n=1 Tax=Zea mays TaxID=4577 RepID=C0PKQ1_MAIZE|nr:unknown [Zea mays]